MDRFEKLEMIVNGMIAEKEKEIQRAKNSHTLSYLEGLRHELIGLQQVHGKILDIKNGDPSVSDEMMYRLAKQ